MGFEPATYCKKSCKKLTRWFKKNSKHSQTEKLFLLVNNTENLHVDSNPQGYLCTEFGM